MLGIVKHPGAFAEYLTLPMENLRVLPNSITDEEAVFTEPIAAACEILEQVRFAKGAEVAVLGDGKLGLLIAQVLQVSGLQVSLYGRTAAKLAVAAPLGVLTTLISRDNPRLPERGIPGRCGSTRGGGGVWGGGGDGATEGDNRDEVDDCGEGSGGFCAVDRT